MTPPAATAAATTRAPRRRTATSPRPRAASRGGAVRRAPARRVSGPLRGATAGAGSAAASVALPLGARALQGIAALPDRAIVERMVRGRAWIAVVGTLLIGLVFMQVTLLGMNAGIGTAVERSAALDRANGELRANVSRLSAGERVQAIAADDGMVMPSAGQVQYGRARTARTARDARVAARALRDGDFAPGSTPAPLPALDTSEQPTLASAAPTSITPTSTTTVAPVGATTPGATAAAPTQTTPTTPTTPSYAAAPVAVAPVPAAAPQTAAPQVPAASSAGGVSAGGATAATGG